MQNLIVFIVRAKDKLFHKFHGNFLNLTKVYENFLTRLAHRFQR